MKPLKKNDQKINHRINRLKKIKDRLNIVFIVNEVKPGSKPAMKLQKAYIAGVLAAAPYLITLEPVFVVCQTENKDLIEQLDIIINALTLIRPKGEHKRG